jgi:hypothetical protein
MDDFNLEESGINQKSKVKSNAWNLNLEFDMIKNENHSEDIESFKDWGSRKETSMKVSQDIASYKFDSKDTSKSKRFKSNSKGFKSSSKFSKSMGKSQFE